MNNNYDGYNCYQPSMSSNASGNEKYLSHSFLYKITNFSIVFYVISLMITTVIMIEEDEYFILVLLLVGFFLAFMFLTSPFITFIFNIINYHVKQMWSVVLLFVGNCSVFISNILAINYDYDSIFMFLSLGITFIPILISGLKILLKVKD